MATWLATIEEHTTSRRHLPHLERPGSLYFTTTTTKFRRTLTESERDIVMAAITFHAGKKYELDAVVVMPDHFHMILRPLEKSGRVGRASSPDVPSEKSAGGYYSLSEIFHSIKSYTAMQIIRAAGAITRGQSQSGDVGRGRPTYAGKNDPVWQDENYDHLIRDDKDYHEKFQYLIYNPVKAGIVADPHDYRWLWYLGMEAKPA